MIGQLIFVNTFLQPKHQTHMPIRTAPSTNPLRIKTRSSEKTQPYHHGTLPEALLQAAETVLCRDGIRGLTLRAIAREAGVSHTAPQHHFGDTAGVLSELAATGHKQLAQVMVERARGAAPGIPRRKATAHGYIQFAVTNPDLFRLMSRNELLDPQRVSLIEARQISGRALAGVFDATVTSPQNADPFSDLRPAQAVQLAAAWAYVHGLATLLIDGRLDGVAHATPHFVDARALVEAAIAKMQLVPAT